MTTLFSVCNQDLERKFTALILRIELPQEEIKQMEDLCDFLKEVLIEEFPNIKMERFGSSASGLGLSHCDLDIHISLGDCQGN